MAQRREGKIRTFTVSNPIQHPEGFTVYRIVYTVYAQDSTEIIEKKCVWKRFNDLKKLHSVLQECHRKLYLKGKFPPFAKSVYFGRFGKDTIEERRQCTLDMLQFAAEFPPLVNNTLWTNFFESGYEMEHVEAELEKNLPKPLEPVPQTSPVDDDPADVENNDLLLTLGGTWEHMQQNDSISLGSSDSSLSDVTDSVRTPSTLSADIDLFDPLRGVAVPSTAGNVQLLTDLNWSNPMEDALLSGATGGGTEVNLLVEQMADLARLEAKTDEIMGIVAPASESDDPPSSSSDISNYLVEVAESISDAKRHEAANRFDEAFTMYKRAISTLFSAINDETDEAKKKAIRVQIDKYLKRAEEIYDTHIEQQTPVQQPANTLQALRGENSELQYFRVLGIIDLVMLVMDSRANDDVYIMKVLRKSPVNLDSRSTIVPRKIPYMIELVRYFETECSILLLLQHAKGGKLWDYLRLNNRSASNLPSPTEHYNPSNVYAARKFNVGKLEEDLGSVPDILQGVSGGQDFTVSYTQLLSDYANEQVAESPTVLETDELIRKSQQLLANVTETLKNGDAKARQAHAKQASGSRKTSQSSGGGMLLSVGDEGRPRSGSVGAVPSKHVGCKDTSPLLSESCVRDWAAQLVAALEVLHLRGIVWQDLKPANLLLGEDNQLLLSYVCRWSTVDVQIDPWAKEHLYVAPEISCFGSLNPSSDWWSLGVIIFELLTGKMFSSCHPSGFYSHSILNIPVKLSDEAVSLLQELLNPSPSERLGSGTSGVQSIKCHPFFASVNWQAIERS